MGHQNHLHQNYHQIEHQSHPDFAAHYSVETDYFAADYELEKMPELIYWNPRYPDQSLKLKYNKDDFQTDKKFFKDFQEKARTSPRT